MFFGINRHSINFNGRLYRNFAEPEFNEQNYKTSHFGYAIEISYGFDFSFGGFTVTPNIGIRRDFFKLELANQNAIKDDFENNLYSPINNNLTSEILGLNFGTKVLFETDSELFNPGFEIGYTIPLLREWNVTDLRVANGPEINSAGFRIGVVLQFHLKNYIE
jgi:hypothetical protein